MAFMAPVALAQGKDPVFAPGQEWQLSFTGQGQTVTRTMMVGQVVKAEKGMFFYEREYQAGNMPLKDRFKYDPVDSDPEFIQLTLSMYLADPKKPNSFSTENIYDEKCYVKLPQKGKTMSGLLIRSKGISFGGPDDQAVQKYVNTGQRSGYPECLVKRIK